MNKYIFFVLTCLLITIPFQQAKAQEQPSEPTYIVQSGDNLTTIAQRFGISIQELINANRIVDPNTLTVGTSLVIPGYEGIEGVLMPGKVDIGDTFGGLIIQYQVPRDLFVRLNRITSPSQLIIGSSIILLEAAENHKLIPTTSLIPDASLLETSLISETNYWSFIKRNLRHGSWDFVPNETIFSQNVPAPEKTTTISPLINRISLSPIPLLQGETEILQIFTTTPVKLTGKLANSDLVFQQIAENSYVSLQGIPRMAKAGKYILELSVEDENGLSYNLQQGILLQNRPRIEDPRLPVDPVTTDPTITEPENILIQDLVSNISLEKLWTNEFIAPIDVPAGYALDPDCITDRFGNLRAYNEGPYDFYHTGLDLSACGNTLNVYATAPGIVVFSDLLTVRGNYILIDHGWGVFSAYGHLKEAYVNNQDRVEKGQLIGLIGNTGRVTGPHLHWEIWVNKVLVDPLDWLNNAYP